MGILKKERQMVVRIRRGEGKRKRGEGKRKRKEGRIGVRNESLKNTFPLPNDSAHIVTESFSSQRRKLASTSVSALCN